MFGKRISSNCFGKIDLEAITVTNACAANANHRQRIQQRSRLGLGGPRFLQRCGIDRCHCSPHSQCQIDLQLVKYDMDGVGVGEPLAVAAAREEKSDEQPRIGLDDDGTAVAAGAEVGKCAGNPFPEAIAVQWVTDSNCISGQGLETQARKIFIPSRTSPIWARQGHESIFQNPSWFAFHSHLTNDTGSLLTLAVICSRSP